MPSVRKIPQFLAHGTNTDPANPSKISIPASINLGLVKSKTLFDQIIYNINTAKPLKICVPATYIVLQVLTKIYVNINKQLLEILRSHTPQNENQLKMSLAQLNAILEHVLVPAMQSNPNEIFYKSFDDPIWQKLKSFYSIFVLFFCSIN